MPAKFHGNILNLSENIAKRFRGATFFDSHCIVTGLQSVADLNPQRILIHRQSDPHSAFI